MYIITFRDSSPRTRTNHNDISLCHLQTLAALPDQDSFYDMVDGLEEQGMETISQRHLGRKGTDLDLVEQLNIYEVGDTNALTCKGDAVLIKLKLLTAAHVR